MSPRAKREPLALHLNWNVLTFVYVFFVAVTLASFWAAGRLGSPWIWIDAFVTPFNHVAAISLLAPLPWLVWHRRSRFWSFAQGMVLSLLACEVAGMVIVVVDEWLLRKAGAAPSPKFHDLLVLYASVVAPAMMVLGGVMAARALAVRETEAIREEAMVAKTRLLQSQLHPHVLFNALNGLAELIHKDPPAAERSVGHLADLLRRILRASEQPTFPLGEERALVEDYLHLEGMRLGPRLQVQWDWDPALNALAVPPLLIQPLVENAIKHGIAPSREGGVLCIGARAQGVDLWLEVRNTGAPLEVRDGAGIGLRNLESRVALLFGKAARFSLVAEGPWTRASVHWPGALIEYLHDPLDRPRCG